MKAKLLKKVRKRFLIIHHPNGVNSSNTYSDVNTFELIDKKKGRNIFYIPEYSVLITEEIKELLKCSNKQIPNNYFTTKKECIHFLCKKIIRQLREEEYPSKRYDGKKVWP